MPRPKHIACQAVCWTACFPQQDLIGQHMSKTTSWGQHPQFVGWHIFENWKTTFETARQECMIAAGSWFDLLLDDQAQQDRKSPRPALEKMSGIQTFNKCQTMPNLYYIPIWSLTSTAAAPHEHFDHFVLFNIVWVCIASVQSMQ
jgi:hypothetical protein